MLSRLLNRSRWPIGLELGTRSVRMLQLTGGSADRRVGALAERALPEGLEPDSRAYHQAMAEAVTAMTSGGAFVGRALVTSPPMSLVQVKNLRLPMMPVAELAEAVMWEATDRLELDRASTEIRFFHAGEVRQGAETRQEVILLALPRSFAVSHVELMAAAGLDVVAVDAPMAALARAVCDKAGAGSGEGESNARLIVHLDEQATQVMITQGRGIVFYKVIDFGAGSLGERANTSDAGEQAVVQPTVGALARELALCLRYYSVTFRGERPGQALLTGAGAIPWLAEQLSEQTSMRVELVPLVDETSFRAVAAEVTTATPAMWSTAMGLCLRGAGACVRGRAA